MPCRALLVGDQHTKQARLDCMLKPRELESHNKSFEAKPRYTLLQEALYSLPKFLFCQLSKPRKRGALSYKAMLAYNTTCPDGEPLISKVYAQCHSKFRKLIEAICEHSLATGRQEDLKQIEDEFAKFKLWAGNLGASHSGKTYEISLDYRLKEASFYKHQVSVSRLILLAPNVYLYDTDNIFDTYLPIPRC